MKIFIISYRAHSMRDIEEWHTPARDLEEALAMGRAYASGANSYSAEKRDDPMIITGVKEKLP